jgi:hypothetical protein
MKTRLYVAPDVQKMIEKTKKIVCELKERGIYLQLEENLDDDRKGKLLFYKRECVGSYICVDKVSCRCC